MDRNREVLIGKKEVLRATGFSGSTLWRRCRDGSFPPPIRTSPQLVAWLLSEVQAWQRACLCARGDTERCKERKTMSVRYSGADVCAILGISQMRLRRWQETGALLPSLAEGGDRTKPRPWSHEDLYVLATYQVLTEELCQPEARAVSILRDSGAADELRDRTGRWRESPVLCAMLGGESTYSVLSTDWVGGDDVREQEAEWRDVFGALVKVDAVVCVHLGQIADRVDRSVCQWASNFAG